MTGAEALRRAVIALRKAGIDQAAGDARRLLAAAMDLDPGRLTLHLPDPLDPAALARFEAHLAARQRHQPVAQILGYRDFHGLRFKVTADTLDPRPDTETLVEAALAEPFARMLDLGTGTGCILLSCLYRMKIAAGTGIDISAPALAVARENAQALGLSGRARLIQSDWFSAVSGRFDLIVSNPPYIAAAEMPGLAPEVRDHEPQLALTPGGDGLEAYRTILRGAPSRLLPGGRMLLEIGWTQAAAVSALLQRAGFGAIRVLQDLEGRDRVIEARIGAVDAGCGSV